MSQKSENLNPRQQEAVDHKSGPLLIIAGAGSGKTKTLTSRLAALIKNGASPENIIAITFTNKAANEMRDRIIRNWKLEIGNSFVGTFHSLGARILKAEAKLFGRNSAFTIFDEDDSLSALKNVLKKLNISKEQLNPLALRGKISKVKNELLEEGEYLDPKSLAIFKKYEEELLKNNAFDFDDLIEKVVRIFRDHPEALEKYRRRFQYVLVDEFQDVNTAQYLMVKLLAEKHLNLSVVGDDAQCVPPDTKIQTVNGIRQIKNIIKNDVIVTASGNGETCVSRVSEVKKFPYKGKLIKITTRSGNVLRLTPNHLIFARLSLLRKMYFVYLMYREDKGFRIGLAKSARWGRNGKSIGLNTRGNQEKADKMWVLRTCKDRAEAEYYEFQYAFSYGIPTVVFDTNNRSMRLSQAHINKLFCDIDTKMRAAKLMEQESLYFEYPHWLPQGTIRHSAKRLRVRITLFDDKRKNSLHPWGMSRISVNTKDSFLKKEIESLGLKTRRGKLADWRLEIARLHYKDIGEIIKKLSRVKSRVEFVKSACLTTRKRLFFQPASHTRPGMIIAVQKGNAIKEEIVKNVEQETYRGLVYDLDVENVHNYIANGLVVHNSIYSFRGSDFRNFLNFENDWPNAKVVKLEQNYRSAGNIITAASAVIKNNKFQKPKELWTENPAGELVKVAAAEDKEQEADWVANKITTITNDNNKKVIGHNHAHSIAILYRTNAQSRAVEQALISYNIPYKIFGGLKFYERKEIKDIVAGLRIAFNPKDSVSAERIAKTFNKDIAAYLLKELPRLSKELSILQLISFFLENSRYFDYLDRKFKNAGERIENINELIQFAGEFKDLGEFLERVSLLQSADQPAKSLVASGYALNPVNLMTIHLAKGLEFENVFVIGCNEGVLPHQMSYGTMDELEEERRLMYVAMTRAKEKLFLSFYGLASRFLYEIPPELTEPINLGGRKKMFSEEEDIYVDEEYW